MPNKCSICLKEAKHLSNVKDTDEKNVTWSTKLQNFVPELIWFEYYFICDMCQLQTENAYEFKTLCINLENDRNTLTFSYILDQDEKMNDHIDESFENVHKNKFFISNECKTNENKDLNEIHFCIKCNINYKSKYSLYKHKKMHENNKINSCIRCLMIFNNEQLLKKHEPNCNLEFNSLKCDRCQNLFQNKKLLLGHINTCKTNLNCAKCNVLFASKDLLDKHIIIHLENSTETEENKPENENYRCSKCFKNFETDKSMSEHKTACMSLTLSPSKKFICNICDYILSSKEEIEIHLQKVHIHRDVEGERKTEKSKKAVEKYMFSCEKCLKQFKFTRYLIEHCVTEHNMEKKDIKPYVCKVCESKFLNSSNYVQHMKYHSKKRTHICSFCGKSYMTQSDLIVHEYTHKNQRNYHCNICEKKFNTNKNLRSHTLVVHTDSKMWKFSCEICLKRFPLRSCYDQHLKRHSGVKDFKCLICSKLFISKTELTKHTRTHSNVRAFKCKECNKEYKEKKVYNIHLAKIHHIGSARIPNRPKNYACHICPSAFCDKNKLTRHLCTHTGVRPFPCTYCEKKFSDKSYLNQHLKITHKLFNNCVNT